MAQYFTDFSEYTTDAQPSDWTKRFVADAAWLVRADGGATGGKVLELTMPGSQARNMLSWDEIDGDADRATVEVLTRLRVTFDPGSGSITGPHVAVRGSGAAGSENAYVLGLTYGPGDEVRIGEYVSGTPNQLAFGTSSINFSDWLYLRVQASGSNLRLRGWMGDVGDEPGTWDLETTDASISAAGWVGLFGFRDSQVVEFDIVGVGTDGDTAPSEPVGGVAIDTAAARIHTRPGVTTVSAGEATVSTEAGRLHARAGETAVVAGGATVQTAAARLKLRAGETTVSQGGATIETAAARIGLRAAITSISQGVTVSTSPAILRLRAAETSVVAGETFVTTTGARLRLRPGTTSIDQQAIIQTLAARLRTRAGTTTVRQGEIVTLGELTCAVIAPTAVCSIITPTAECEVTP